MRRPWPALVLSLGGAGMLAALYLPWQRASADPSYFEGTRLSLLNLFSGSDLDGWDSAVAPATALAALLLAGLSALAWARPELITRLPLARCALVAAYFAVAVAVETRSRAARPIAEIQLAYGAYLGLGAAAAAVIVALLLRHSELRDHRSPAALARAILVTGLLVALLLPWERLVGHESRAISWPAAQVAVVLALCLPGSSSPPGRLGLAVLAALFTAAAFSTTIFPYDREYGSWIGLGFALALVAASLTRGIRRPNLEGVPWSQLVLGTACLLLVAGLFLPWQGYCYPPQSLGPSSVCVSVNGYGLRSESATGAAVLALALVLALFASIRHLPPRAELAAGIALLVTTLGFQLGRGGPFNLRYGFWVGVLCTGLIVILAARGLRRPPLDARLAPIAVCLAYLAIVVPTWWRLFDFDVPRIFYFAAFSWITLTGALLAITLIRLWLERPLNTRHLLLVPVGMAGMAALDLTRAETITWGGGVVLALCALLAFFAWIEHSGGFGRLGVPEILRVDRL